VLQKITVCLGSGLEQVAMRLSMGDEVSHLLRKSFGRMTNQ